MQPGKPSDCWPWLGAIDAKGYGNVWADGRSWKAHRLSYTLLTGPIPDGLELHHTCRNPPCVNPDHLQPVTHAEHMGLRRKERCVRGHEFRGDNLGIKKDGHRYCIRCAVERTKERRLLRTPVQTHSYAGYSHGCRCDVCRAANTQYHRDRRTRLRDENARAVTQALAGAGGETGTR